MIVGFLGKGGSGKTTLSTRFTQYLLQEQNKNVLAIDSDHNMDFVYNLGAHDEFSYLGDSLDDLHAHVGLEPDNHYSDAFFQDQDPVFSLRDLDDFTNKYSHSVNDQLRVMAGGPHTDRVLYGKSCSHVLFTALKVYLPFLELAEDQAVVVDEKAGLDGVSTGIPTGFNYAVVASEPTVHSTKVANDIADLLNFYEIPYEFVVNKVYDDEDRSFALENLSKEPLALLPFDKNAARLGDLSRSEKEAFANIVEKVTGHIASHGDVRRERSRTKFSRNNEYKHSH